MLNWFKFCSGAEDGIVPFSSDKFDFPHSKYKTDATRTTINLNLSYQLYKSTQLKHDVHHLQKKSRFGVYIQQLGQHGRFIQDIDLHCADHPLLPLKIQNRTGSAGFSKVHLTQSIRNQQTSFGSYSYILKHTAMMLVNARCASFLFSRFPFH